MRNPDEAGGPPEAPPMDARLRFGKGQLLGLIVLLLVPVAALAGAFGESWTVAEARTSDLGIRMRYPDRYRYKQINNFEVFVQNTSGRVIDTVTVSFDTSFVMKFSNPVFVPGVSDAFEIPLTAVRPGETRVVVAELQGEHYWVHEGDVRITSGGADTATIPLRTLILP